MNQIRSIQKLNAQELEAGITNPNASWHVDYRDTAFVNFGGLPYNLSEGDIITIFSQFGEPTFVKLVRDKETGKSKGFGWLKYEDQRSTDLAVDNLGGAEISGRMLRVDHARFKMRDDEDPAEFDVSWETITKREREAKGEKSEDEADNDDDEEEARRPMLPEEIELARLIQDHDEDDPMKAFLIEEKKKEIADALARDRGKKDKGERRHKHRHRRSHRSRREGSEDGGYEEKRRSKRDDTPLDSHRQQRDRNETPERKRGDYQERRRRRDDDEDDRDRRHRRRHHREDDDDSERRHRHRDRHDRDRVDDRDRNRDQDRDRKSRRTSRSRSPRRHRD